MKINISLLSLSKVRLYKEGLITTCIGLLILIFGGILMYQEKATPLGLTGWFGLALLFLRSKDSLIGLPKNDNWKKNLPNSIDDYLDSE